MRNYVIVKSKGDKHSELINSCASLQDLRNLLDKMYKFYDEYTCEPGLYNVVKLGTAKEIKSRLRLYNYYIISK